jgi:uncharacterized protein YcnI
MTRSTVSALLVALSIPASAYAHVSVTPRETKAGAEETYTVRVPTEKAVATTTVELEVPDGVTITKVGDIEGAKHEEKKTGDRITTITWTREIKPRESAQFMFTAKNPAAGEKIVWKIHQRYADGTVSDWTPATTLAATAGAGK